MGREKEEENRGGEGRGGLPLPIGESGSASGYIR